MTTIHTLFSLSLGCALVACQGGGDALEHGTDPGDGAGPAAPGTRSGRAAGPPRVVTLLTGHRVTVHGDGVFTIESPRGSIGSAAIRSYRDGDHLHVVPAEVEPLLAAGQLDRRLFDVTELLALDYDDAQRADLPLIVTYQPGPGSGRAASSSRGVAAAAAITAAGGQVTRSLASINGSAVRAPRRGAHAFWSAIAGQGRAPGARKATALAGGIARIWLDGVRRPLLDQSAVQIGAPAAWAAGLTGQDVTVAVLDSGIDASHPDFAGHIADSRSFIDGVTDAIDDYGHGTHVASILAGTGAAEGGRYRGIAPDARLLVGKVCDQFGTCPESAIIAGMEWAAESGAAVVNLSLGGADSPEVDPLEEAINTLTAEHDTLFVVAAGNFPSCGGPHFSQVGSPSTADAALSVGAVDREDVFADFSCRGPRAGDGAVKPDIAGPGVDIVAARAVGTLVGDLDPVDDFYTRLSGTSMATPHVAGAAAILAQQHPDWHAADIKAALMASARAAADQSVFLEGAGRVDVARAITQDVLSSPVSLAFGMAGWPHDDDEPVTGTLTYQNRGASPISLQLTLDVRGPDGAPAGAGMFAVDPAEVTVPPGGEAQVTVTADTRGAGPDGDFGGALIAAGADRSLRTPLSVIKEEESHDLELILLDRDGAPVEGSAAIIDVGRGGLTFVSLEGGSGTVRLRRGTYAVDSGFLEVDESGRDRTISLVQPHLELLAPTTVTMDGRLARPVAITVPVESARRVLEMVEYSVNTAAGSSGGASVYAGVFDEQDLFDGFYTAQIGPSTAEADFSSVVTSFWAEPGSIPGDRFADSPYIYNTVFVAARGGFPTGFAHAVDPAELATVENEYAQSTPGLDSTVSDLGLPITVDSFSFGTPTPLHLPARRTAYYVAEDMIWLAAFYEEDDDQVPHTLQQPVTFVEYEPGEATREAWNQAVIGPNLRFPDLPVAFITRSGDQIDLNGPTNYGDRSGHYGFSFFETGTTRLFRDGSLIGEGDSPTLASFSVPPEPGDYRLEVESSRGGAARLSTQVTVAWTFRSETVPDGETAALPTLTVRFTPRLDERNAAPTGRLFVVPFEV
ncbi:MAG TPA: S8 family serine peptidase, partial [Kofleriaceae bacterium]|nr:S8 family serine peptidase [Kofleriaceae bacterium]